MNECGRCVRFIDSGIQHAKTHTIDDFGVRTEKICHEPEALMNTTSQVCY